MAWDGFERFEGMIGIQIIIEQTIGQILLGFPCPENE